MHLICTVCGGGLWLIIFHVVSLRCTEVLSFVSEDPAWYTILQRPGNRRRGGEPMRVRTAPARSSVRHMTFRPRRHQVPPQPSRPEVTLLGKTISLLLSLALSLSLSLSLSLCLSLSLSEWPPSYCMARFTSWFTSSMRLWLMAQIQSAMDERVSE